jgi:hypothetical protein
MLMPRTDWLLAVVLAAATTASRVPWRVRLLPTWDAVQFALALAEYDVVKHQPHPPGYILYVAAARALDAGLGDATESLTWLSIAASGAAVFLVYRLAWLLYGRATAVTAAVALAGSPLFWFYGEVPLPYAVEAALATGIALLAWRMGAGRPGDVVWSALALGIAGGVRQSILVVLGPLWLAMAWTGTRRWRPVLGGVVVVSLASAVWLVPMLWLAGGPGRYMRAGQELFESTVRATTILDESGGWRRNLQGLGEAMLMGLGALLPVLAWPRRGKATHPHRGTWSPGRWLFVAWIVPPLLVYSFVHLGQYGYVLTVLPALCILTARRLVLLADGAATGAVSRRWRAAWAALLAVTVLHAAYFVGAKPVDVPELPADASALERRLGDVRAFYRFRLWAHTAAGLRETERVVEAYVDALRREFDPARTVLITELGNPRSYPWFRHVTYYLPEFTVYHLRLGRFSPGYLASGHERPTVTRPPPTILLPPATTRLVWMVDAWNPTLPRPPGLEERAVSYGRRLYVLRLERRLVEHGDYRLTHLAAVASTRR